MRPLPFTVKVYGDRGAVVVAPRGELDLATADQLSERLAEHEGAALLVLDLRGLTFMDSSGVALVLEHQRRAEAAGKDFRLVAGVGEVQRLFEVTGLVRHLRWTEVASLDDRDTADVGRQPPRARGVERPVRGVERE